MASGASACPRAAAVHACLRRRGATPLRSASRSEQRVGGEPWGLAGHWPGARKGDRRGTCATALSAGGRSACGSRHWPAHGCGAGRLGPRGNVPAGRVACRRGDLAGRDASARPPLPPGGPLARGLRRAAPDGRADPRAPALRADRPGLRRRQAAAASERADLHDHPGDHPDPGRFALDHPVAWVEPRSGSARGESVPRGKSGSGRADHAVRRHDERGGPRFAGRRDLPRDDGSLPAAHRGDLQRHLGCAEEPELGSALHQLPGGPGCRTPRARLARLPVVEPGGRRDRPAAQHRSAG